MDKSGFFGITINIPCVFISDYLFFKYRDKVRNNMKYEPLAKFKQIGKQGQKTLEKKTVAIVGLGNIGSTLAVIMVRSGIEVRLIDKGRCHKEELSAQCLYTDEDDTRFKAKQAKKRLKNISSRFKVKTFHEDLDKNSLFLLKSDLIIDATGNLETSKLIAGYAYKNKIPLIFAVNSGSQGLILTTNKKVDFEKLKRKVNNLEPISRAGIIGPTVHMTAAIIAKKAFKILLNKQYKKEIISFDVWEDTIRRQKL